MKMLVKMLVGVKMLAGVKMLVKMLVGVKMLAGVAMLVKMLAGVAMAWGCLEQCAAAPVCTHACMYVVMAWGYLLQCAAPGGSPSHACRCACRCVHGCMHIHACVRVRMHAVAAVPDGSPPPPPLWVPHAAAWCRRAWPT